MCVCGGHKGHPSRPPAGLEPEHLLPGEHLLATSTCRAHPPPRERPLQTGRAPPGLLHPTQQFREQHLLHRSTGVTGLLQLLGEEKEGGGRGRGGVGSSAGVAAAHVISEAPRVPASTTTSSRLRPWLRGEEEPLCLPEKPGVSAPRRQHRATQPRPHPAVTHKNVRSSNKKPARSVSSHPRSLTHECSSSDFTKVTVHSVKIYFVTGIKALFAPSLTQK